MMLKRFIPVPVKKALKQVQESSLVRSLYFDFNHYVLGKTPVIVLQMGKVGSKTVVESLKQRGMLVYHAHTLNADHLRQRITELDPIYARGPRRWLWMHNHIIQRRKAPVKYITLVREPNAINVAGFFENLDRFYDEPHAHRHHSLDELLAKYDSMAERRDDYEISWFDRAIKVVPGIDVYDHPFDKTRGLGRIKQGKDELLILKLETPDAVRAAAIADYLGLDHLDLISVNVGEDKDYADLYKAFKAAVHIPEETLSRREQSRYFQHFYTPEEIAAARARWSKPDSN